MNQEIEKIRQKTFNPKLRSLIDSINNPNSTMEGLNQNRRKLDHKPDGLSQAKQPSSKNNFFSFQCNKRLLSLAGQYLQAAADEPYYIKLGKQIQPNMDMDKIQIILDQIPQKLAEHRAWQLLDQILLEFWRQKTMDQQAIVNNVASLLYAVCQYSEATAMAGLLFFRQDNCYRPIFHFGLDDVSLERLAFSPSEKLISRIVASQAPQEMALDKIDEQHFIKKKLSPAMQRKDHSLVLFPIISNFSEVKPKNLFVLLVLLPTANLELYGKNAFLYHAHKLLRDFYPALDQLTGQLEPEQPNHLADIINSYLRERRFYFYREAQWLTNHFFLIQLEQTLQKNNRQLVEFRYIIDRVAQKLSVYSKILRYSYNKAYILLVGDDMDKLSAVEQIMAIHQECISWRVLRYPEHGKNLYNYQ